VEARARDLARDLAVAIREKRRYPVTDEDLAFYLFMKDLVTREKVFMRDDHRYWEETGLFEGFESYVDQRFTAPNFEQDLRKEWLKETIKGECERRRPDPALTRTPAAPQTGSQTAATCRELLESMPLGFNSTSAGDLEAVYQFEITGSEEFTAHLRIAEGRCTFHEGPSEEPDLVIKSPADVWLAISRGELDGQTAFMSGKYKVSGNMALLLKLGGLFSR
jgi:putative sterol carrier protein